MVLRNVWDIEWPKFKLKKEDLVTAVGPGGHSLPKSHDVCIHGHPHDDIIPCWQCHPETHPLADMAKHVKDTNPKDAVGIAKAPMSTVSAPVMLELGVAMMEGARKYSRHNYRAVGVRASVYYDALQRHVLAWWEGEDLDPDSGLNHITKAIATLTVLRDSMIRGNWVDDRPPAVAQGWIEELNERAAALLKKYPNPPPPYTNK